MAIAALVLACSAMLAALLILTIFGGYALLCLMTAAPPHVLATVAHYGALTAAVVLPPLSVPALILGVVARVRSRNATGGGDLPGDMTAPPRRSVRAMATIAIVLAAVCLFSVFFGVPFWNVEPCWTAQC